MNKGFAPKIIIMIVVGILAIGIAGYYSYLVLLPAQNITSETAIFSNNGEAIIGILGGKIILDKASIIVPKGAVSENTNFSIKKITSKEIINTPLEILIQAGDYYLISSTGDTFQEPIEIQIPYDESVSSTDKELAVTNIYIWNGEEYIAIPTDIDSTTKTLKSFITELGNDTNVIKIDNNFYQSFYVFKKNVSKIQVDCQNSGGKFNGHYCECPPNTYWENNSSKCIPSEYIRI